MPGISLTVQDLRNHISSGMTSNNIWWKLLFQAGSWVTDKETAPPPPTTDIPWTCSIRMKCTFVVLCHWDLGVFMTEARQGLWWQAQGSTLVWWVFHSQGNQRIQGSSGPWALRPDTLSHDHSASHIIEKKLD